MLATSKKNTYFIIVLTSNSCNDNKNIYFLTNSDLFLFWANQCLFINVANNQFELYIVGK